ncbi:glycosyltransferase family 4 protein [Pseudarthrobacter sp. C1]|uniref:glycosyltransferase family 4 protein n=1 Tax=Pseudarthrobacter sp. C1 TaxID=3108940 RepID=UPI002B055FCA|nr:glycosyltransferase family 4 protein [Pseudarthrobacter sp. C1]MEA3550236.1 glycosyltransferase family 4 protein [Pseudarthrobacter sp. C1]
MKAGKAKRPDVLYLSSFFNIRFSILPQILHALGFFGKAGAVVAPRGEFGPGALGIKPARKRIFIFVYRRLRLHRRVIWHASSVREANDIYRALGTEATVLVRENDTALPVQSLPAPIQSSRDGRLRAVFIGRISVVKGLLDLIQSFASVATPFEFNIYGPEEDSEYAAKCRHAAERLPNHITVTFHGAIENLNVRQRLAQYDVMLFPTKGENFGHVIAEALSVSCPVVCADVTPWTSVLESGGGLVVRTDSSQEWTQAVESYAAMTPSERVTARVRAGQAFDDWRQRSPDRHIFEMVLELQNAKF